MIRLISAPLLNIIFRGAKAFWFAPLTITIKITNLSRWRRLIEAFIRWVIKDEYADLVLGLVRLVFDYVKEVTVTLI